MSFELRAPERVFVQPSDDDLDTWSMSFNRLADDDLEYCLLRKEEFFFEPSNELQDTGTKTVATSAVLLACAVFWVWVVIKTMNFF